MFSLLYTAISNQKIMTRTLTRCFIVILTVFTAIEAFAQRQEAQGAKIYDKRMAKIPKTDADTGIDFREGDLMAKAWKYFADRRQSGEIKDLSLINELGNRAFKSVPNHAALKSLATTAWQPTGGDLEGQGSGRVRDIAFDGPNIVYVATASGGIWKTENITDVNPIWVPLTDKLSSNGFGAIALCPSDKKIIYAGTGEINGGYAVNPGDGVFKSTDGGLNWTKLLGTGVAGTVVTDIIVDPKNTNTVYISTPSKGILRSIDAGNSWKAITISGVAPISFVMDPVETNRLYAAGSGKIYRSLDSGATWTQCKNFTPTLSGVSSIMLAVAQGAPNIIYASIGNSSQGALGLYFTNDYGVNWKMITTSPANWLGNQGNYANAITVHPTNGKQVFVGGLDVYRTNDSGKTFNNVSDWTADVNQSGYVHADIHRLRYNGTSLYACSDGGIAVSKNSGGSWNSSINKGIATLQFVGVDADRNFTYVIGGTQDNGTNRAGIVGKAFDNSQKGDGGFSIVAQNSSDIAFATYYGASFTKSQDSGMSFQPIQLSSETAAEGRGNWPFYTVYDYDAYGSIGAYAGASHIWVTTDGGSDGIAQRSTQTLSGVSSIHVFPEDGTFIWAGIGANVYRSVNTGLDWVKTSISSAGAITGIISDPADNAKIWVCSQGSGATNKHVWKSVDGGVTFTALPNFPSAIGCNAIARQHTTGKIFVATDYGVMYTDDEGATWQQLADGLPIVAVQTLKLRGANNDKLLAGTYGRGMFWLDIANLGGVTSPNSNTSLLELAPISPNPIRGGSATLGLTLTKPTILTVTLYDVLGREVKLLEKKAMNEGTSSILFSTQGLSSGSYVIVASAAGISKTQKIVVE